MSWWKYQDDVRTSWWITISAAGQCCPCPVSPSSGNHKLSQIEPKLHRRDKRSGSPPDWPREKQHGNIPICCNNSACVAVGWEAPVWPGAQRPWLVGFVCLCIEDTRAHCYMWGFSFCQKLMSNIWALGWAHLLNLLLHCIVEAFYQWWDYYVRSYRSN